MRTRGSTWVKIESLRLRANPIRKGGRVEDPSLICLLVLHWYQSMEEILSLSPSMEEEEGEEHGEDEGGRRRKRTKKSWRHKDGVHGKDEKR